MEKNQSVFHAHHLIFKKEYTGKRNKYGGLPTHLPEKIPSEEGFGEYTFLCQIYCDKKVLDIPDTLCIQIYQLMVDGVEGCDPVVVQLPPDAKENTEGIGIAHPELGEGDIVFEEVMGYITDEAIEKLEDEQGNHLIYAKLGGWCPYDTVAQENYIGEIPDYYGDCSFPFNWGAGYHLVLMFDESKKVTWYMESGENLKFPE